MHSAVSRPRRRSRQRAQKTSSRSQTTPLLIVVSIGILTIGLAAATVSYGATYEQRIFPGVRMGTTDLGGMTAAQAKDTLLAQAEALERQPLVLRDGARGWTFARRDLGLIPSVDDSLGAAMAIGRTGPPWEQYLTRYRAQLSGIEIPGPAFRIDTSHLEAALKPVALAIDRDPIDARIVLKPGRLVSLTPATPGRRLNVAASVLAIERALPDSRTSSVNLVVDEVDPRVSAERLASARSEAERVLSAPLVLRYAGRSWTLSLDDIASFTSIDPTSGAVRTDDARLSALLHRIAQDIDRPAANARFDFKNGRLVAISTSRDGARLDVAATAKAIEVQMRTADRMIELPVEMLKPAFGQGDSTKLVARDLIANAETIYGDTISNRRFNVELAASRLNGTVVGPGEVFSLNHALGEVSYRTGYKQAYGITQSADGVETIPSEGGGICQVATTLFQAIFWAGYPIVERSWHLYWIPRYGLPPRGLKGLDATIDQVYDRNGRLVYSVDFKFKNNTDRPLLIQAHTNGDRIRVSLFGTKPSWQVKLSGPVITGVVKANRENVLQPSSTLPPGQKLMVEEAEDGFTSTIVRKIVRNGRVIGSQTFRSVYQASRNVWLVGGARGTADVSLAAIPADRPAPASKLEPSN